MLSYLHIYSYVYGTAVDVMHSDFLGLYRQKLSRASNRHFYRQFASIARSRNFDYVVSERGYKVALPRKIPRTVKSDVSVSEKAWLFLERGESESYVKPKWIDTTPL